MSTLGKNLRLDKNRILEFKYNRIGHLFCYRLIFSYLVIVWNDFNSCLIISYKLLL